MSLHGWVRPQVFFFGGALGFVILNMSLPEQTEDYIDVLAVQEEVVPDLEDAPEPVDSDEDHDMEGEEEHETIEVDMSNNLSSYFDQHQDSVFTVFTHPTLPLAVSGGGDETAYMWTTHQQPAKLVTELKGHKELVIAGAFTADGQFCITGDMAGAILVHQALKRGQVWTLCGELNEVQEVTWIATHPLQQVFAFGGVDGSVWVYLIDPQLEQIMLGFSHQMTCNGGVFANTGDMDHLLLVTYADDGLVVGWNAYTGEQLFKLSTSEFRGEAPPWVLATLSPDTSIVALGARDAHVAVINTANPKNQLLTFFKALEIKDDQDVLEALVELLAWCGVQPILAAGCVSGDVLLFDTKTWRPRRQLKVGDAVTKLQFLPNLPVLVGSTMEGKVHKWDSRTGAELFVGVGHNMGVLDFAFADGGKKIITAGDEGVLLVFEDENV